MPKQMAFELVLLKTDSLLKFEEQINPFRRLAWLAATLRPWPFNTALSTVF
jgi:hypothetical protein